MCYIDVLCPHSFNMFAASCLLTEDQFLCSICLEVFTDPVTTPCGHNFCKTCICQYWDTNVPWLCPNCKEVFNMRPELKVNTLFSEITAQFRQSARQHVTNPGEVSCDVCKGTKPKALKSCQVMSPHASYCETHLESHFLKSGLRKNQLAVPVENLEGRMCLKHGILLELFCKTDQMCVCMLCSVLDHKTHNVVPLEEEYKAMIEQMIQVKHLKVEMIKRSVVYNRDGADREIGDGMQVFNALKESVEKQQAELVDSIKEKQRKMEMEAKDLIKCIKQEICELKMRSCEVEQLSKSNDHLHLFQGFLSLKAAKPSNDLAVVSVRPASYEGSVARAVKQLEESISEQLKKQSKAELKRVKHYAVDVTLDDKTAHPYLIISEDRKQVHLGDVWKTLPNNPKRFDTCVFVLARESFSSGRFYYEVHVKGNTEWALGVARGSIIRKGIITASSQNGYWTIWLRSENEYIASAHPSVRLSLRSRPETVGVFVDYEEGLVSFYDVNAAAVMYSFTLCCFTETIYPIFYPCTQRSGKQSAPLIISPVNPTV